MPICGVDDVMQIITAALRPVHTGNFVAIFGNKLLPETATNCCRFVAVFRNNLLPFSVTICCQCGQYNFVDIFGNKLLPICCRFPQQFVASVDRPLGSIEHSLNLIEWASQ